MALLFGGLVDCVEVEAKRRPAPWLIRGLARDAASVFAPRSFEVACRHLDEGLDAKLAMVEAVSWNNCSREYEETAST